MRLKNKTCDSRKEGVAYQGESRPGKGARNLEQEQQKLQREEKSRQQEITAARGKEQELQKTLQQKQRRVNQLNAQIEQLIAEEVARQSVRRKHAAGQSRRLYVRKRPKRLSVRPVEARVKAKGDRNQGGACFKEEAAPEKPAESGPRIEAGGSATTRLSGFPRILLPIRVSCPCR